MLDEHDREPQLAKLQQQPAERLRLGAGEAGRGLVEQEDARTGRERPGNVEQSLLAGRERRGGDVGDALEADRREQRARLCSRRASRRAGARQLEQVLHERGAPVP